MTNKAKVLYSGELAGYLEKNDNGYSFAYDKAYLKSEYAKPVSQTLPLSEYPYDSRILFSFFDGLIPEGWLLNIASNHRKIKGPTPPTPRSQLQPVSQRHIPGNCFQ